MEPVDEIEEEASPLKALGLHRVGAPLPQRPHLPTPPPLNKRGMPVRIRKKNPMYFDENLVSSMKSPRGSPRKPPIKPQSISANTTPKKLTLTDSPTPSVSAVRSLSLRSQSLTLPIKEKSPVRTLPRSDTTPLSKMRAVKPEPFVSSDESRSSSRSSSFSGGDETVVQNEGELEPPSLFKLNLNSSVGNLNVSASKPSPSKVSMKKIKLTPIKKKPEADVSDFNEKQKISATQNGARLRNFLKLPQAHKWIYYEWFYANIDRPLFLGPNDFELVMNESCARLKTRLLTRRQWSIVRRCMGKPRRCSQAFFDGERKSLDKRRQVLRLLQQRKITDIDQLRELRLSLPSLIPCQLVIGSKVTARIRRPENGLYVGRIDAVDTSNNTYRITFSNSIGTHSIPDYEVLSCDPPELIPIASFQQKFRPRPLMGLVTPPRALLPRNVSQDTPVRNNLLEAFDSPNYINNDPVLAQAPPKTQNRLDLTDNIGQYSVESLMHIVQLWKLLEKKAEKVKMLDKMNTEAEKVKCKGEPIPNVFQCKYANLVLEFDELNDRLNCEILRVQTFCQEISGSRCNVACPRLLPGQIKERCMAEANAVVQVSNSTASEPVTNVASLKLVTSLTALMLQIKNLGDSDVSAFELTSIQSSLNSIRDDIHDKQMFRNLVDVPLTHIMAAASQLGPLNAFSNNS